METKIYVAGGWFSPAQMEALKQVEHLAAIYGDAFMPRLHNLGEEGCNWEKVFEVNIDKLNDCDIVIASTVDKDMGTIFECGYAYSRGKQILYYSPGIAKPNLMLGMSGLVFNDIAKLELYLQTGKYENIAKDYE